MGKPRFTPDESPGDLNSDQDKIYQECPPEVSCRMAEIRDALRGIAAKPGEGVGLLFIHIQDIERLKKEGYNMKHLEAEAENIRLLVLSTMIEMHIDRLALQKTKNLALIRIIEDYLAVLDEADSGNCQKLKTDFEKAQKTVQSLN